MPKSATAYINGVFGSVASAKVDGGPVSLGRTDTASVAAATANAVDTLSATTGGVHLSVTVSAISGTTPSIAFALWDSADNVTFTAVPGAAIAAMTAAGSASVTLPDGTPVRRYVAIATTVTGTAPSATWSAVVSKDQVRFVPALNPDGKPQKDTRT